MYTFRFRADFYDNALLPLVNKTKTLAAFRPPSRHGGSGFDMATHFPLDAKINKTRRAPDGPLRKKSSKELASVPLDTG